MSETTARRPETLADVKAGDEVLHISHEVSHQSVTVDRVTKTQIVVGIARFSRADGREISSQIRRGRSRIAVGAVAAGAVREIDHRLIRIAAGNHWYKASDHHRRLTRAAVDYVRAACDAAETALRELGEWTDESGSSE